MLTQEEHEIVEQVFADSQKQYPFIHRKKDIYETDKYFDTAHILSHYGYINIFDLYGGSNEEIHFAIAKLSYNIPNGKHNLGSEDLQIIATKKLDKSYGRIIIRPESWEDKFREVFYRLEIDFESNKEFSSDYYYLTEDKELGLQFATENRLRIIAEIPDIYMEVIGQCLIAKFNKTITTESALALIHLMENI